MFVVVPMQRNDNVRTRLSISLKETHFTAALTCSLVAISRLTFALMHLHLRRNAYPPLAHCHSSLT